MRRQLQAVIFDFGGVLTLPPLREQTRELAALCGLEPRRFRRQWRRSRGEYDRGTVSARAYWTGILAAGGRELDGHLLEELVRRDFASWSKTNEPVLAWARHLAASGLRTAILSNMPLDLLRLIRQHLPWVREFPSSVFSCEVGRIKPDPEIFRACLEALDTPPGRALFVDDYAANVRAARGLGLAAIRYRTARALQRALGRGFGLQLPSLPTLEAAG